jgi:hypothetical protein
MRDAITASAIKWDVKISRGTHLTHLETMWRTLGVHHEVQEKGRFEVFQD